MFIFTKHIFFFFAFDHFILDSETSRFSVEIVRPPILTWFESELILTIKSLGYIWFEIPEVFCVHSKSNSTEKIFVAKIKR